MDSHDLVRPVKLLEGIQADLKRLIKLQELVVEKMYIEITHSPLFQNSNYPPPREGVERLDDVRQVFAGKIFKIMSVKTT